MRLAFPDSAQRKLTRTWTYRACGLFLFTLCTPVKAQTVTLAGDIEALFAYLQTVPPVAQPNRAHDLPWFMTWRFVNQVRNWLFSHREEQRRYQPMVCSEAPT